MYIHTFPNGKHYVGITRAEPLKRWKYGAGYEKQTYMKNAIQKYGWKNIYHSVIYSNLTKEEAEQKEISLISLLRSNEREYGYNIANGGNGRGSLSEESRRKISESRKGIIFSPEHKRRLSESHKNYKPTEAQNYKDMMSSPHRKEVMCVETGMIYPSIREAGRQTGIYYKTIGAVCNHQKGHKTAGGYKWVFIKKGDDE